MLQGFFPLVEVKVLTPCGKVLTSSVKRNSVTQDVLFAVMEKTGVAKELFNHFALFEVVDHNFGMDFMK